MRPYAKRISLAALFLVLAAVSTLIFPIALRSLIDGGLMAGSSTAALAGSDRGTQVMALREHFMDLFAVAVALGLFSAGRFYMSAGSVSASRRTCATPSTPMC